MAKYPDIRLILTVRNGVEEIECDVEGVQVGQLIAGINRRRYPAESNRRHIWTVVTPTGFFIGHRTYSKSRAILFAQLLQRDALNWHVTPGDDRTQHVEAYKQAFDVLEGGD